MSAPITWTNRYISEPAPNNIRSSSMGGWYYYAVGVGTDGLGERYAGVPIKIAFSVKVEGEPSDAVEYDGAGPVTGTTTHPPAGADDRAAGSSPANTGSSGPLPWIGLGLGLAAVAGAGAYVVWSRRRVAAARAGQRDGGSHA